MPNPFTKYTPTQYVPTYVPMPLEQYAQTINEWEAAHRENLSQYGKIDIMLSQMDVPEKAKWVIDEAKNNINESLDEIIKTGRWKDATYLLPEVFRKYVGGNKDLIHSLRQKEKINEAEKIYMQYGGPAGGFNFNPGKDFEPIIIDQETGEKKYVEYTPNVQQRLDWNKDMEEMFNQTLNRGSTGDLTPVKDIPGLAKYIEYSGLQKGSDFEKYFVHAFMRFRETPSYKQMYEYYTSPYYGKMSPEEADKKIMDALKATGEEFIGRSSTHYVNLGTGDSKSRDRGSKTTLDVLPGVLNVPLSEYMKISSSSSNGTSSGAVYKYKDGQIVRMDSPAEYKNESGGRSFGGAIDFVTDLLGITDFAGSGLAGSKHQEKAWRVLTHKRTKLSPREQQTANHLFSVKKRENPNLSDDQIWKEVAKDMSKSPAMAYGKVYYEPFNSDEVTEFINSNFYYNTNSNDRAGMHQSRGNIQSMKFYDLNSVDKRISGNVVFENVKPDIFIPLGKIDKNNPWGLVDGILWTVVSNGKEFVLASEGSQDLENDPRMGYLRKANAAAFNNTTYITFFDKDSEMPFYDKNRNPVNVSIKKIPQPGTSDFTLEMELPGSSTPIVGKYETIRDGKNYVEFSPAESLLYHYYYDYLGIRKPE